ncbi:hypothetical protein [Marinobacter sp.]|nr:hypothetical protein [Pseudomonadales bacterium]
MTDEKTNNPKRRIKWLAAHLAFHPVGWLCIWGVIWGIMLLI